MTDTTVPNLWDLRNTASAVLQLTHPADATKTIKRRLGVGITLAGPGHPQTLARAEFDRQRDNAEEIAYGESVRAAAEAMEPPPPLPRHTRTVAESTKRNVDRVAARVISSDPFVWENGEVIQMTPDNAAEYLCRPDLDWLYYQAVNYLQGVTSFLSDSASA